MENPALHHIPLTDRETKPAMKRGWKRTCPNCGAGPIFDGYLKVHSECKVCGEDFTPQRADDGPAYITILIVAHIVGPSMLFTFETWRLEPLVLFLIFSLFTIALCLFLLPRVKGAFISLQWAKGMHGFGRTATNKDNP